MTPRKKAARQHKNVSSKNKTTKTGDKKATKKWKQYESKAAKLLKAVFKKRGYKNVETEHNVWLQSKAVSIERQIDVSVSCESDVRKHRFIIEAKDHAKPVSVVIYDSFVGKLVGLDDQTSHGVMVSSKGFQKGARELAKVQNIELLTMTAAEPKHFADKRVPSVHIKGLACSRRINNLLLQPKYCPKELEQRLEAACAEPTNKVLFRHPLLEPFSLATFLDMIFDSKRRVEDFEERELQIGFLDGTCLVLDDETMIPVAGFTGSFQLKLLGTFDEQNQIQDVIVGATEHFLFDQAGEIVDAESPLTVYTPVYKLRD